MLGLRAEGELVSVRQALICNRHHRAMHEVRQPASISPAPTAPTGDPTQAIAEDKSSWTVEASEKLYQIGGWGEPYFATNAAGHIVVSPQGDRGGTLDLYELVEGLRQRNLNLPLLVRFPDILADRLERLQACFNRAIARYGYAGTYQGVYPIKCNQNRQSVEALVAAGRAHRFGLEAGSKPELTIALAILDTPGALLVCNGYKDREYIETALLATQLGHHALLAIEQLSELDLALAVSRELGIRPTLGLRAKLSTRGSGRWGTSTGDRAKFGLSVRQILQAVDILRAADRLDCLQLLHFHIGSQISAIGVIKDALREAAQLYVELYKLGANLQYLDVGGGLAVDYDGSKTNSSASKNYNMQNYANDIVAAVRDACGQGSVPAPVLVSESGRAIAAHQAVLICEVLGSSDMPAEFPDGAAAGSESTEHLVLRNLWETYETIALTNCQETYHDALQFKEEAISLFNFGYLSLEERARAERLFWACVQKIYRLVRDRDDITDELKDLERTLASTYYINCSIFRSLPDVWAIDQQFPIVPIHRLDEAPTQRATLADLTCDSDGKIDRFINGKSVLELHPLQAGNPYYLGVFLAGAYQEIMGNAHNLFGAINVAQVRMQPKGYAIERVVKGDAIATALGKVQYDGADLLETIRCRTEQAVRDDRMTLSQAQHLLQNYERSLRQYTYLKSEI